MFFIIIYNWGVVHWKVIQILYTSFVTLGKTSYITFHNYTIAKGFGYVKNDKFGKLVLPNVTKKVWHNFYFFEFFHYFLFCLPFQIVLCRLLLELSKVNCFVRHHWICYKLIILSSNHFVDWAVCQLIILPADHFASRSFCQLIILSFYQLIILSTSHSCQLIIFVNWSFCQVIILSTDHFVN